MEWALLLLCVLHVVFLVSPSPAASSADAATSFSTAAWVRGTGGGVGQRIAGDSNITLIGEASVKNGSLSLTSDALTTGIGASRALYSSPVRFFDPATRFAFSIRPSTATSASSSRKTMRVWLAYSRSRMHPISDLLDRTSPVRSNAKHSNREQE